MSENKFYTYTLARPDGRVFYVGKGVGKRWKGHETEARKGKENYKCRIIRKVWAKGGQIIKQKVLEGVCEEDAFECEKALIAFYGRENLANLTNGGEGSSGWVASPETRARQSAIRKGRKFSEAHKEKIGMASRGKKRPPEVVAKMVANRTNYQWSAEAKARQSLKSMGRVPSRETREKIAIANRGKTRSAETRERIAVANRGKMYSPEMKAKFSESHKGFKHSEETKAKIGEKSAARMRTPEMRTKYSEINRGRVHSAESRAKMSAAKTGNIASPETRARMSLASKAHMNTPEAKERMANLMRERNRLAKETKLAEQLKYQLTLWDL